MTEEYIQICFGIISQVGVARSLYVEAVRKARAGEFDAIEGLQKEANELFVAAQNVHLKLLQQEASGESVEVHLLLVHAEDLLVTTETIKILTEDTIELYRRTAKQGF